ncbi:Hypothetical_protein [Hexamita inflata]|uniref:Hypothetical_protein n=1 Tax=Hexamita inflata TaxID=28002 RepID=A0AA86NZH6_9EUKA|nr:Hypothetical protein HINF_LOCUS15341 [Hexamita inflata]CAI9972572.1 Hypothetical protein HINF_LOCUS60217 [Hexamita inflata]
MFSSTICASSMSKYSSSTSRSMPFTVFIPDGQWASLRRFAGALRRCAFQQLPKIRSVTPSSETKRRSRSSQSYEISRQGHNHIHFNLLCFDTSPSFSRRKPLDTPEQVRPFASSSPQNSFSAPTVTSLITCQCDNGRVRSQLQRFNNRSTRGCSSWSLLGAPSPV